MTERALMHYGIPGMKWGKHKRVEPEGITKQRARLAEAKLNVKKTQKEYNKNNKTYNELLGTFNEERYAKEDLASAKILNKLSKKEKSKEQLAREEKYKAKGYSDDEAAVAAYQYIRTRNILAAIGTTAVVAGTAYAAYKIHDSQFDKILKSGTKLQNIAGDSDGVRDAFYASKGTLDKSKYAGLYGHFVKSNNGKAFKKEVEVLSDIKVASSSTSKRLLSELFQDRVFSRDFEHYLTYTGTKSGGKVGDVMNKALTDLKSGKTNSKHVYEAFNISLVDHEPMRQSLTDEFYKHLSNRGYNAIKDVNDSKYSGYLALNPLIVFGSGKAKVVDVKEMTDNEILKNHKLAWAHLNMNEAVRTTGVKYAGYALAYYGTTKLVDTATRKVNEKQITKYRSENPNSKLTNTEIIRMLEKKELS